MARQYNMLHRVTYAQIIDVLKEAREPLFTDELEDRLPCEPDSITLSCKLETMAQKGLIIKSEIERGCSTPSGYVSCINRAWSLPTDNER